MLAAVCVIALVAHASGVVFGVGVWAGCRLFISVFFFASLHFVFGIWIRGSATSFFLYGLLLFILIILSIFCIVNCGLW